MSKLIDKIYELRDYDSDAADFVSGSLDKILADYEDGVLTKEECAELVEDLQQTKQVAALAEQVETKILTEEILNEFISVLGSL